MNSKNRKEEIGKVKRTKKENLMTLREIKQVERKRHSLVQRDPDNILY
jgi:hypothetical protein